jgi:hypothetical protein
VSAHLDYLYYVLVHKFYVFVAGRALGLPLLQLLAHDLSKFSKAEWGPYARIKPYFGRFAEAPPELVAAFDVAWEHHWTNNPHHPEYWAGGDTAAMLMAMPDHYVREMVADWYGAGMAQGKPDIIGWYIGGRSRRKLHATTQACAERYLRQLGELGLVEGTERL